MHFQKSTWRLILHPARSGSWNMAVDEAILEAVGKGSAPATLRLYSWEPPCLSLGFSQPIEDVDLTALETHGWDLVRRPTGGRAILHADEITYAVIGSDTDARLSGGVLESYQVLAQALLKVFYRLGIPAEIEAPPIKPARGSTDQKEQRKPINPVCFEVPSSYEITLGGKKLVGSAQARRKEGVLQHGSIPLGGDLKRIVEVLRFPNEAARENAGLRLLNRATTIEMFNGKLLSWEQVADAFAHAFQESLNLELDERELSLTELKRAEELAHEKYAQSEWTNKTA